MLDAMKTEKDMDQHWTEKQVEQMAETGLRTDSAGIALRYMTVQKNVKPNCEVCRMRIWNKVQHGNQQDSENSDYLHRLSENEGRTGI